MPYTLKNLSGFPLDVPTLSGPAILPANGELCDVELGALDAEIMRQSPYVEISDGGVSSAPKAKAKASGKEKTKHEVDPALVKLRIDYEELFGKKPFNGWKAAQLQDKIDAKLAE
ncbi:hypothetical protein [Agrobacterium tumefaciens]|uniref:hypothetical protein n=1 Tax=Agrobacterium tumefaciens TaxID=358 RepID=UPI001CBB3FC6|nr:hypothetical protein [Agrobacterium tumefaciens]